MIPTQTLSRALPAVLAALLVACSQVPQDIEGLDPTADPTTGPTSTSGPIEIQPTGRVTPVGTGTPARPTRPPGGIAGKTPRLTGLLGPWSVGETTYSVEIVYDNPRRHIRYRDERFIIRPSSLGRTYQEHGLRGSDASPGGVSVVQWAPDGLLLLELIHARRPCTYDPPVKMFPREMRDGLTWEAQTRCGAFSMSVGGHVEQTNSGWTIYRTLTYRQDGEDKVQPQRWDFDDLDWPASRAIYDGTEEEPTATVKKRLD